jgi:galactose mutarotase-like enzyme
MSKHVIRDTTTDGHPTITLSGADTATEATFAPTLGMIGCSFRHRGAELLGQRGGLTAYAQRGSTMGIPLLHPWANRLSGFAYAAGGRSVTLDPDSPLLHRDSNGLPMHGLLAASPHWKVTGRDADDARARLSATFGFDADAALLAAFPFPHTLALDAELRGTQLSISVTLTPSGGGAVPVSFGFHPYLQLPGVSRRDWQIETPVRRRLRLDARGIPTGDTETVAIQPGALGDRTFDDLFTDLEHPARFVLAGGGRRITVDFDEHYRFAQIYAPAADALICFEPMTAPTNALVSGDGLILVGPGDRYRASFAVAVHESV